MRSAQFRCRAILFDLDGVLVDSTAAVRQAWLSWSEQHGLVPERVVAAGHGRRTVDTIREVAPHLDAEQEAAELEAAQATDLAGVVAAPGAATLLASLTPGAWAVVTSGTRQLGQTRLRAAGLPAPAVLVGAEDVSVGKPDPSGYLHAARLLGLPADACLVVEDAPAGVAAARAAGMPVLGLVGDDPSGLPTADAMAPSCAQLRVTASHDRGLTVRTTGDLSC